MWAMVMVVTPRPRGPPIKSSSATNSNSNDRPVITSGITSGAEVIPLNRILPRKRPMRASARPASVPRTTATVAVATAMRRLNHAARRICASRSNSPYHRAENPPHTVTSFDALNE